MLVRAIGEMLPAALAIALSPFPIIAIVLALGTERGRMNGATFALGWTIALAVMTSIVLVMVGGVNDTESTSALVVDLLRIGVGIAMMVLGAKKWGKRPRAGQQPALPGWMASFDTVTPGRALVLGLALAGLNPKNLALTMSGTSSIAELGLEGKTAAVAAVIFVVLGSITVIGALLFSVIGGPRADAPLGAVKEFMVTNNAVIVMVVLLVLGAKVLGDGLSGLSLL